MQIRKVNDADQISSTMLLEHKNPNPTTDGRRLLLQIPVWHHGMHYRNACAVRA